MIHIKTKEEIQILREGGRRLATILHTLAGKVAPGVSSLEIDRMAKELSEQGGDKPAFLGYRPEGVKKPYPASICISINDEVVHGIPREKKVFKEGDIVTLDMGLIHKGLVTDSAITIIVGKGDKEAERLVESTRAALRKGIAAAKAGNTVGDIGYAIEQFVKPLGYGQAEGLAGHGVGYHLHEDPYVPNTGKKGDGPVLKVGMVIAIEPMLTEGSGEVTFDRDGYTVRTKDGSRSTQCEHTVAITENGPYVLTELG
jgi:methionyl aminopeptidase